MKRKRYSWKFQRMAVECLRTSEDAGELAQELGVTRRCLYKWRAKLETVEPGEDASRPSTHASSYRKQIHQLKRLCAAVAVMLSYWLRGCIIMFSSASEGKMEIPA